MVLSSQAPRAGSGRAYGRSGRRSTGRWKAAVILLLVAVGAYVVFFRGGGDESITGSDGNVVNGEPKASVDNTSADVNPEDASTGEPQRSTAGAHPRFGGTDTSDDPPLRTPPRIAAFPPDRATDTPGETRDSSAVADASEPTRVPDAAPPDTDAPQLSGLGSRTVTTAGDVGAQVREGLAMLTNGNEIAGRAHLSALLLGAADQLAPGDADLIRTRLADLNAELVFSPRIVPNDPATTTYRVQPGDLLGGIARQAKVPYPLLEMVNGIQANRMRADQTLKLVNGPIHARVDKSAFVMDLYLLGTDGTPVFLAAFPVGLGENDNTPLGKWVVAAGKVTNPSWRNPRTNQFFAADDPDNPIGEYWLPITGLEGAAVGRTGFGVHGTIDPDSIGRNLSMGCVRLNDADIALVYHMLAPGHSTIDIVP